MLDTLYLFWPIQVYIVFMRYYGIHTETVFPPGVRVDPLAAPLQLCHAPVAPTAATNRLELLVASQCDTHAFGNSTIMRNRWCTAVMQLWKSTR